MSWTHHKNHLSQSRAETYCRTAALFEITDHKLSMHYYLKTRACTDNPAHYTLHEFDPTTRYLYLFKPNGKVGMTRPPTQPVGLKLEEALTSAEIDAEMVCPLKMLSFPPGTHEYDPERHSLIERRSEFMITRQEAWAKFHEYHNALGPHDEVYINGSKINERVGAAAVINRHFQNGETTCHQLSKRFPDNSNNFAAEATAITLALGSYRYMDPVKHCVVVYSDSMSCLQAIEGEDTENPSHLPCHQPPLGTERQRHSCPLLLVAKPLRHRGEWDSGPVSKGDLWPWHRPTGNCSLCRSEACGEFLYPTGGSNQVGCVYTW